MPALLLSKTGWPFHQRRSIIGTCTVRFHPQGHLAQPVEAQVEAGALISDAAQAAGIDFQLPCGGQGRCGRCMVIVQEGQVTSPPSQRQIDLSSADAGALPAGQRVLACQATIESDAVIFVPETKI